MASIRRNDHTMACWRLIPRQALRFALGFAMLSLWSLTLLSARVPRIVHSLAIT